MPTKKIEVQNVTFNGRFVTVTFNDGAYRFYTPTMQADSPLFRNDKKYHAQRFTFPYEHAVYRYITDNTRMVHNEDSTNEVRHYVYMYDKEVYATKVIDCKVVQTYNWTGLYSSHESLIESFEDSGHKLYNVITMIGENDKNYHEAKQVVHETLGLQVENSHTLIKGIVKLCERHDGVIGNYSIFAGLAHLGKVNVHIIGKRISHSYTVHLQENFITVDVIAVPTLSKSNMILAQLDSCDYGRLTVEQSMGYGTMNYVPNHPLAS